MRRKAHAKRKLAVPAIKAYNAVADSYHQTLQKKGQPLHEGFTIVKVRAARVADPAWWLLALFGNPYESGAAAPEGGSR